MRWKRLVAAGGRDVAAYLLPWFPQNLATELLAPIYAGAVDRSDRTAEFWVRELTSNRRRFGSEPASHRPGQVIPRGAVSVLFSMLRPQDLLPFERALVLMVQRGDGGLAGPVAETVARDMVYLLAPEPETELWMIVFMRIALRAAETTGPESENRRLREEVASLEAGVTRRRQG